MRTLIGLMPKSSHAEFAEKMPVRPRFFGFYHACTEILILTFIVWHGYIGLAVCYLIALMLYEGTRERIVKLKAAA
jgi:hypothetical protein